MRWIQPIGFIATLFCGLTASAQTTLNSAGGSQIVGGNVHSWSVGEMTVVNTATSGNITVTHGVLQPANGPTAVTDAILPGLFEVFPNPTTEAVRFRYQFPQPGELICTLLDVTGKSVWSQRYPASARGEEIISLQAFTAGTYLLRVQLTDNRKEVSATSYTIQKIR